MEPCETLTPSSSPFEGNDNSFVRCYYYSTGVSDRAKERRTNSSRVVQVLISRSYRIVSSSRKLRSAAAAGAGAALLFTIEY